MLLFLLTKNSWWNVVPWNLISQTKPGFTAMDTFVSHYQDESGMYCVFYTCFDVYCLRKFSKYIPYKLSIEKQRSFFDAWGLDLQNDI